MFSDATKCRRCFAIGMELKNGVIWMFGIGEDGVKAFTDFGIENLNQVHQVLQKQHCAAQAVTVLPAAHAEIDTAPDLCRVFGAVIEIIWASLHYCVSSFRIDQIDGQVVTPTHWLITDVARACCSLGSCPNLSRWFKFAGLRCRISIVRWRQGS